jgi:phosphatidylinositol-3-phosphatase
MKTHRIAPLLLFAALRVAAQPLSHPGHIVIVIEENKNFGSVIDALPDTPREKSHAPYLNSLARRGALLTNYHALHHPSQPNYLEIFSGSEQGVCNDNQPQPIDAPNLATNLVASRNFAGYAEDLPASPVPWTLGDFFARRHCPWLQFTGIPNDASRDFKTFPQTADGFGNLPAVTIVIPNLFDDMHTTKGAWSFLKFRHNVPAEVLQGDRWLETKLSAYVDWAMTNNSLLIVTWDEDGTEHVLNTVRLTLANGREERCEHAMDTTPPLNRVATIIVGQPVTPGSTSDTQYTHHDLLRTILEMEGLAPIGGSISATPITGIWR